MKTTYNVTLNCGDNKSEQCWTPHIALSKSTNCVLANEMDIVKLSIFNYNCAAM